MLQAREELSDQSVDVVDRRMIGEKEQKEPRRRRAFPLGLSVRCDDAVLFAYWPWWVAACGEAVVERSFGGADCSRMRSRSYSSASISHCSNSASTEGVRFFILGPGRTDLRLGADPTDPEFFLSTMYSEKLGQKGSREMNNS